MYDDAGLFYFFEGFEGNGLRTIDRQGLAFELPDDAFHLFVFLVPDDDDLVSFLIHIPSYLVDLLDHGTGGVDDLVTRLTGRIGDGMTGAVGPDQEDLS